MRHWGTERHIVRGSQMQQKSDEPFSLSMRRETAEKNGIKDYISARFGRMS